MFMAYNFRKFLNVNKKTEDKITVTKSSSIGFPKKFYDDNKVADFKYVVLFYDEAQKVVGIQFINDEAEKSKFTIIRSKASSAGGAIIARSFFKTYNIDTLKYSGRYEYKKENIEGIVGQVFVIQLKEKVQTGMESNTGT